MLPFDRAAHPILTYITNFAGMLNFILKSSLFVVVMIWVRWTLPRLRIDQVMKLCLKYCVPIAAVMFLGATIWTYNFPGGVVFKRAYGDYYKITTDSSAASEPGKQEPAAPKKADAHAQEASQDPHAKTAALETRAAKGT